jgi:hypothetical protein
MEIPPDARISAEATAHPRVWFAGAGTCGA